MTDKEFLTLEAEFEAARQHLRGLRKRLHAARAQRAEALRAPHPEPPADPPAEVTYPAHPADPPAEVAGEAPFDLPEAVRDLQLRVRIVEAGGSEMMRLEHRIDSVLQRVQSAERSVDMLAKDRARSSELVELSARVEARLDNRIESVLRRVQGVEQSVERLERGAA